MINFGLPLWLGVIAVLAFGAMIGMINGLLVVRTAVPSLIVTFGTLFSVAGLVLGVSVLVTGTTSVRLVTSEIGKVLFGHFINNTFQVIIFWWLAFTAVYIFFVHYSPYLSLTTSSMHLLSGTTSLC